MPTLDVVADACLEQETKQRDCYAAAADYRIFMEPGGEAGVFDHLARLPADTLLTEGAIARMLGVSTRTIRRMVERFELPPPFRNAGRSCWFAGKVLEWMHAAADRSAKKMEQLKKRLCD